MESGKILVLGSSNTDMTVKVNDLPVPGETVLGGAFTMGAGGKGANQAVAAKRLGGDVSFICKVGNDVFGDNAISSYNNEGLDTCHIMRSELPSGVALISVDEKGENCIVVASGANSDFSVEDVEKSRIALENCGILLLQLEIPGEAVLHAARIAYKAGALVILNPAPYSPIPDEIFKYTSLFVPNEVEISSYAGMEVKNQADALEAAKIMEAKGINSIVVTLGCKGSLVYNKGTATAVESFKVNAADTTAAGDTFCGALAVALAEGECLENAVRFATKASALTVQKMGAQNSMPYRNEITI